MKLINGLMGLVFLGISSQASAIVFAPTDNNTNFFGFVGFGTLYMFDEDDTAFAGDSLLIIGGDQVTFTPSGVDFDAAVTGSPQPSLLLHDDKNFLLAVEDSHGGFLGATGYAFAGTNSLYISFVDHHGVKSVLEVDVKVVPVPAAVWLFGSGLIGLVGIARRKKT